MNDKTNWWIVDTETDGLRGKYTRVHSVVFRNVKDKDVIHVFRKPSRKNIGLLSIISTADIIVGHNLISFDRHVCRDLLDINIPVTKCLDTLVISRMIDFSREAGHSLESYSTTEEKKSHFNNFDEWSKELEERCIQDTMLNWVVFKKYERYIDSPLWKGPIELEHLTTDLCDTIYTKGFLLDIPKLNNLYNNYNSTLCSLKESFSKIFPKRSKFLREVNPVGTLKGTINSKDFRFLKDNDNISDLSPYSIGSPFSLFTWEEFNPSSPLQRVQRLNEAGWKPVNKTKGHIQAEREKDKEKLARFREVGWATDEENLATLPKDAPEAARKLAEFILLDSRVGDLKEWFGLVDPVSGRLHGTLTNPGTWSMRISHQKPNMANISTDKDMRSLWIPQPGWKLVGVDADAIQLRIFAHLCEDLRLIDAIEKGKKEDQSDIHSLNKSILGIICNSRDTAKTFIYALLLGAQLGKIAQILSCTRIEAEQGMNRILDFYPGWKKLLEGRLAKEEGKRVIQCIDGRYLPLPKPRYEGQRLALTGHLQSGEKIIMSRAAQIWKENLKDTEYNLVNWVHDEWQTETPYPEEVGDKQIEGIRQAGIFYSLGIKLEGNKKIGNNWAETH